jgi:protein TonB
MTRAAAAFIISVIVHVVVVNGLALPAGVQPHNGFLMIHIKNPDVSFNESLQETISEENEIQAAPKIPISQINEIPLDDTSPTYFETPQPNGETEPVQEEEPGITGGMNSGVQESQEPGGQGPQDGNSAGQGNGAPSETGTDDQNTPQDSTAENQPGPDLDAIRAEYRQRVLSAIESRKEYPQAARRLRQDGTVSVRFIVSSDGAISGFSIASSSGIDALDYAARDAVLAASPVPPIPEELGVSSLEISLQIVFSLD